MPFITVRDLQVYYELRGTGPRLLNISGTRGDLRRSPNIFEMPIARHFEILAYDQRGLGQTSRPDIPYTGVSDRRPVRRHRPTGQSPGHGETDPGISSRTVRRRASLFPARPAGLRKDNSLFDG